MDVEGDLTITSLYRLESGDVHVSGNVTTVDTSIGGSGTIVLDGTGTQTISANGGVGELRHLAIDKPSGDVTLVDQIQISGSYADNGNTVDATGATVEIQENATIDASGTAFGDVTFNAGTVTVTGELDVEGDLTITSLYRLESGDVHVSGNVTTVDTSIGGSGTIVLDGTGTQTISANGGVGELRHLAIDKPSGDVTLVDQIQISGSYADNGNTVDATGATVEIQENATIDASGTAFGDVTFNAGTVTVTGELDVEGDLTITSLYRLESGDVHVSGNVTTVDTSIGGSGTIVLDGTGTQTISANGGVGELRHLAIDKPSGDVTLVDQIQISGSYADNGNTVDATGATVEIQENATIDASGTAFGDVTFNAGTVTVTGELDVEGDLTITSLYRLESGDVHVSGNVTTVDTSIGGSGTIVLDGTGTQTISANGGVGELRHLAIDKPSGDVTLVDQIQISGSYADNGNTVDATGATVVLQANAVVSANTTTFGDVEINGSTITVDGDLWVDGDLTISSLYRLEGGTIHVTGETHVLDGSWSGGGNIVGWNVAPSDVTLTSSTVAENASAGTVVGTALPTDPDPNETFSFELTDDANGCFEIDAATGEIRVAEGAVLDHEAVPQHLVTVKVTDSAGFEYEETLTIGVGDVNEAIEDLVFSGTTVAENAPAGTVVGTASASDPDAGDTLQFALSDDADGRFAIDADTGQIVVAEGASLDHEAGTSHTVTVKVTDAAGHELEESFTIGVGDVNEAIEDLVFSGTTVAENAPAGTVVGTASASDPDAGDTLQFALSDDADGRFAIDADTGQIVVAEGASLDHEAGTSHTVTVKVTDAAGHELEESFTIGVGDVNEAIEDLVFSGATVAENCTRRDRGRYRFGERPRRRRYAAVRVERRCGRPIRDRCGYGPDRRRGGGVPRPRSGHQSHRDGEGDRCGRPRT